MSKFLLNIFLVILLASGISFGQGNAFVQWKFSTKPMSNNEKLLIMEAGIAPGWHLYSQFIDEGGPMPTSFRFEQSRDYLVIGKPQEDGNLSRFRDDIYEMEITWYTNKVSFLQRIRILQPGTTVNGIIEYMVCNEHSCIPARQEYSVFIE